MLLAAWQDKGVDTFIGVHIQMKQLFPTTQTGQVQATQNNSAGLLSYALPCSTVESPQKVTRSIFSDAELLVAPVTAASAYLSYRTFFSLRPLFCSSSHAPYHTHCTHR